MAIEDRGQMVRMARLRNALPVVVVVLALLVVWYGAAVWLNAPQVMERQLADLPGWTWRDLVARTWAMDRPVLPAPHQIAADMIEAIFGRAPTSPRSLVYHALVTASSTLTGFVLGTVLGMMLAVAIVHSRLLERGLLPWVVASQMVPILAVAPIVIVILGSMGLTGLFPKSVISMYLCFFPVTVAMVKGLRAPGVFETELMHTYAASASQVFWKLRLPSALPFLFPALRIAISAGLAGAIVGELPTGAQAGLGARLLAGSYYGQTVQIWSALVMCALMGVVLTGAVAALERLVLGRWGAR